MQFRDAKYFLLFGLFVFTLSTFRLVICGTLRSANSHFRLTDTDEDEEERPDVSDDNLPKMMFQSEQGGMKVSESGYHSYQEESEDKQNLNSKLRKSKPNWNSEKSVLYLQTENNDQNLPLNYEMKDGIKKQKLESEYDKDIQNLQPESGSENSEQNSENSKIAANIDTELKDVNSNKNNLVHQRKSNDIYDWQNRETQEENPKLTHNTLISAEAVSRSGMVEQDKAEATDISEHDVREIENGDSIFGGEAVYVSRNGTTELDSVKPPGRHVPKYMLDLYNANLDVAKDGDGKANNDYWFKNADTVKGFINANGDLYRTYDDMDNSAEVRRGTQTRIHTLVFHVTEMDPSESLDYAELRLYALITRDQRTFLGVDRLVTIILVSNNNPENGLVVLDSRHVYEKSNAWETFNVTAAVRHWTNARHYGIEQRLEVRIDSIFSSAAGGFGHMDITTRPYKATEPLLLVYSSDPRKRKQQDQTGSQTGNVGEVEMAGHRDRRSVVELTEEEEEEESNMIIGDVSSRRHKKKRHRNPCRRKPLTVDFGDINYDTWILAPREYEAFECSGKCYFPLSDHLSPTQHAIIQTLLHNVAPKRSPRACCVPTKLGSISILYLDKDGVATYKYRHDDMVVTECGCR